MKLHALIAIYNAVETIQFTLDSLLGRVDQICMADNKWIGMEGKLNNSDDGTTQAIIDWSHKHPTMRINLFLLHAPMHQVQVRNFLLSRIPEEDWILSIDSDEIVTNWLDIRAILEKAEVKGFRINGYGGKPLSTFRLLKKTKGLHYTRNHRYVDDAEGKLFTQEFSVLPIQIEHHPLAIKKAMRKKMEEYKKNLWKWENAEKTM